jgi:hypothetical protein
MRDPSTVKAALFRGFYGRPKVNFQPSLRDCTPLAYPTQHCVLGYSQPSLSGLNPGLVSSHPNTEGRPLQKSDLVQMP